MKSQDQEKVNQMLKILKHLNLKLHMTGFNAFCLAFVLLHKNVVSKHDHSYALISEQLHLLIS